MDLYQLEMSGRKSRSCFSWCSFFLHTWQTQGEKAELKASKSIVSQLICFQSHAWTLLHQASPHPKTPSLLPESFSQLFPKSKSWELLAELKSYNTLICWRSWLTWLNYSGRAKRVLEKFCFVKMTTQRSAPVSESLDSGETSIAATWEMLPWKSSRPNNSKAAGLERIIHVVKDSTNLPARGKVWSKSGLPGF